MTQPTYLYFVTDGASTSNPVERITLTASGTSITGTSTLTTASTSNYPRDLALNSITGTYYLVSNNESNFVSTIYQESLGSSGFNTSPYLTITNGSFTDPNDAPVVSHTDIAALTADSTNNQIYYVDRNIVYRSGVQIATLGNVDENGTPEPARPQAIAYDAADSTLLLGGSYQTGSSDFSISTRSLTANYIYKITGVTKNSGNGVGAVTSIAVPFSFGGVAEMAMDTANDTLYFITKPVGTSVATGDAVGLYALALTGNPSNSITQIWSLSSPPLPFGNITDFTVDPLTGEYYIATSDNNTDNGTIFAGNISVHAAPTTVLATTNAPIYNLAIDDALPPPTISLSSTSNEALQGGGSISVLASAPALTDATSTLANATITLGGYVSGDVLGINGATSGTFDSGKITYSASNGVLTFSGTDSLAEYSTLLGEVTFQDGASEAASNAHPTHTLNWVVGDSSQSSSTTTTTITIDRAPATSAESASLVAGAAVSGSALTGITDPDGDSLSVSAITGGVVGSPLSGTYGALTLSSNGSYNYSASNSTAIANAATGSAPVDHFTFTVSDGKGGTAVETLSITIDRAPNTSAGATTSLAAGATVTGAALTGITDPDGDSVSITAVAGGGVGTGVSGTYGVLTISSNGSYTYSANNSAALAAAATGSDPVDHFTFNVSDGKGGVSTETLTVSIDRAPIIASGGANAALLAGGVVTGAALTGDTDPDGDSLTISSISGGALGSGLSGTYGVVTLNANGSYLYSANNSAALAAAATGSEPVDHFTFTVTDGHGAASLETLAVTIDRAPIIISGGASASAQAGSLVSGGPGVALAGDSDPDGDNLTISSITGGSLGSAVTGSYGQLTLNSNGSYTYAANNSAALAGAPSGSAPVDYFTFTVTDGKGAAATETLAVSVDRAPIISSLSLSTTQDGFLGGPAGAAFAGDTDPDGRSLSISSVNGANGAAAAGTALAGAYGTLTLNADGSYSYAADNDTAIANATAGSAPVDQFTFTVTDGSGPQVQETLDITVNRPAIAGTGAPVTYTQGDGQVTVDAGATVSDPDNADITGAIIYTTNGNLPGDVLSFTAQSGITGSFANGTLALTGTASAADYQAALQSVQFSSTDADPYANGANPFRTVGIVLTDAAGQGQPASALIEISSEIDIPAGDTTSLISISSGRDIDFLGTGASLNIISPADFAGSITGFNGDTINLVSLAAASESFAAGILTVYDGLGDVVDTLTISEPAGITSADFHLADDGFNGTDITLCFYPGTRIATPTGEVAVEHLQAGDLVLTSNGPAPLRWVGRSEIATRFANKLRTLPIRISAGALGDNLPQRDLLLSPDHALFMDHCLIQASALINHTTIRRETNVPEHFTYYHLELDHHALLLAEGALAESFVDNVDRMHFHNWDDRTPTTPILELPYPRAKSARQLPQTLRWIHAA